MEQDKELYKRFVEGDISAFEELVLRHKDNLIYFLMRYVNNIDTCEDIAQDSFLAIFVKKGSYNLNEKAGFKTYLYAIAKNKATDHIRKFSRIMGEDELENQTGDNFSDEIFNRVVKNEEQKLLHNAISKLKLDYQRAILLIDIDAMSYSQAAAILDKSLPQMKILIFRARNSLKKLLIKEGLYYEK